MNGFGLDASAAALDVAAEAHTASAGAITAAAARLGAAGIEHGFESALPGGRTTQVVERVVVHEGEHLAEGAAEAAIGSKIAGAIEGGLKGGLTVEAMEVAAAAGVTLTAGSVAFIGLTAGAILAGLRASMEPKHRASDEPGFGKPFAPGGFDPNRVQHDIDKARKPWFNRTEGAHPHSGAGEYHDSAQPGHWAYGRGDTGKHWVLEDRSPLKNAPFFATAPLGPDGLPITGWFGMPADPTEKRTWVHIGPDMPLPSPEPAMPLAPPRPLPRAAPVMTPEQAELSSIPLRSRTLKNWILGNRPAAADGMMLTPHPPSRAGTGGPVPVTIVSAAPSAFHDVTAHPEHMPTRMLPPGMRPNFTLGNNSGTFGSPGMGTDGHFGPMPRRGPNLSMLDAHPVEPHVDDSELIALDAKLTEVAGHAQSLSSTPISVRTDLASLETMISLLTRAISLKAQLGSGTGGSGTSGGTSGSVGTSYPQTAPSGRMGGPR